MSRIELGAPQNVVFEFLNNENDVKISWDPVENAVSYGVGLLSSSYGYVFYKEGITDNYIIIPKLDWKKGIKLGSIYVKGDDVNYVGGWRDVAPTYLYAPPENVRASYVGTDRMRVTFDPVERYLEWELSISPANLDGVDKFVYKTDAFGSPSAYLRRLEPNTEYTVSIRCRDQQHQWTYYVTPGDMSTYSKPSVPVVIKTKA